MPNDDKNPQTNLLTYGFKSAVRDLGNLRYSRYRGDALFRLLVSLGLCIGFLVLMNMLYPSAGDLLQGVVHNQFGAAAIELVADGVGYGIEVGIGLSIGSAATEGAAQIYYNTCSPYPSPDYKPLNEQEKRRIIASFNSRFADLHMNEVKLERIASELLEQARAYPDISRDLLLAYKLLFKGEISQLMAHEHIREVILHTCTSDMSEVAARDLVEVYRNRFRIPRIRPLGFEFPNKSLLFYGITSLKNNILDIRDYHKRRVAGIFKTIGILIFSGGSFYAVMYGFPLIEPIFEGWLDDMLRLHKHNILKGLVGIGSTLVGASIGQFVSSNIYKVYAKCRYGVSDPGVSLVNSRELAIINANMPEIILPSGARTRVYLELDEVNEVRQEVIAHSIHTRVPHTKVLVDFIHGKVSKAFMHPRTGPLLIKSSIREPDIMIAALRQFNFISRAAIAASLEIARGIRERGILERRLEETLARERDIRHQLDDARVRIRSLQGAINADSKGQAKSHRAGYVHPRRIGRRTANSRRTVLLEMAVLEGQRDSLEEDGGVGLLPSTAGVNFNPMFTRKVSCQGDVERGEQRPPIGAAKHRV